jgi:hypothetical protein
MTTWIEVAFEDLADRQVGWVFFLDALDIHPVLGWSSRCFTLWSFYVAMEHHQFYQVNHHESSRHGAFSSLQSVKSPENLLQGTMTQHFPNEKKHQLRLCPVAARCDGCVLGAGPAGSEWSSLQRFGPSGLGVGLQQIAAVITWEKLEHRQLQKTTWRFSIFGIAASTSLKLCLPWVGPFDHDVFTINPTVSLVNHTFQPLQYNVIHQLCQRQPEINKPWLIFTILDPKNSDRILDFSWNREFWEFHIDYIHWKSQISLFQLHHTMAIFWPSLGASPQL